MNPFRIFLLVACLATGVAWGAEAKVNDVRVKDMSIHVTSSWERSPTEAEDAIALNWKGRGAAPLQALILRLAEPAPGMEEEYYNQIRRRWNEMLGGAAIGWMEVGENRWLACRHPSLDQSAAVFHLVTVFQGHAYSVMFLSSPQQRAFPAQAMELIRRTHFGEHVHRWGRFRSFVLRPTPKQMSGLLKAEETRLGKYALLTGYEVNATDKSIAWTFEGYSRPPNDRSKKSRKPFVYQGVLELHAAEILEASPSARLRLDKGSFPVRAGLRLRDLCADMVSFDAALEQLEKGVIAPMSKLLAKPGGGCDVEQTDVVLTLEAKPGEEVRQALDRVASPHLIVDSGSVHAQVLEVAVLRSEQGERLGDRMLPEVWVVTLFLPSQVKPTPKPL